MENIPMQLIWKTFLCVFALSVLTQSLKIWNWRSEVQFQTELSNMKRDMHVPSLEGFNTQVQQSARPLEACKKFNRTFPTSMEENMNVVKNYKFTVPTELLHRLQLDDEGINTLINRKQNSSIPVIVSGISDNHFGEFDGLLHSINIHPRKKYPEIKFIVFDLGLSKAHRADLQKKCKCDVRTFPFEKFPSHVKRLQGYTWKPISLQMMLQEYDFIMWVDSSIRFNEKFNQLFERARRIGIQILEGDGSITVRTHRGLFDFLKEEPCMFNYPEVQPGWFLIKRTKFALKMLLRPVVSCALQYGCMDFPDAGRFLYCKDPNRPSACHRYDQSVHGIILTRIFNKVRNSITFKEKEFGSVSRS
ncbi:uncharacterized protein LOC134234607 [Saccostrea cucullata]|uniref:uncharacterized protein LOC134234607 n=1 Tax=Saccostrea cuccullata TaxID=36930 RepID=UPI002ED2736A